MTKKTRKLKGGKTTLENFIGLNSEGPLVTENLYQRVKEHKGEELKNEYKMRKDIKDAEYKIAHNEFKDEEERNFVLADKKFKYEKLHKDDFLKKLTLFLKVIGNSAYNLGQAIGGLFKFGIKMMQFGFKMISDSASKAGSGVRNAGELAQKIFNSGNGAVVKFILLIIFIALFFGLAFGLGGTKGGNMSAANNNNKFSILSVNGDNSFLGSLSTSLNDMIPSNYRIQFTSFKNTFNKFLGNDIVGNLIDNQPRETTSVGRYNGITNIKKVKDNSGKIYNIFKPSDKELIIDLNLYSNDIDFYNLPEGIRNEILAKADGIKANEKNKGSNDLKYKFDFVVTSKQMPDGREKYFYNLNNSSNIPLTNDKSLNNHFNLISIPPEGVTMTKKDYEKNRNSLMFSFKDNKYIYPEDDFYKYKK